MQNRDPAALVPLKPNWFHILLSLAQGARHGYAIMKEVAERTDGKLRLWPTTLYGAIRRMEKIGLVEPTQSSAGESDDKRRQYYAITPFGEEVLKAESIWLEKFVKLAQVRTA